MLPLTTTFAVLTWVLVSIIDFLWLITMGASLYCLIRRTMIYPIGVWQRLEPQPASFKLMLTMLWPPCLMVVALNAAAIFAIRTGHGLLRATFGTLFIALFAGALCWLKVKRLFWYAIIEALFGFAVCAQTLGGMTDYVTPSQIAAVLASVYLLVRAYDNYHKSTIEFNARQQAAREEHYSQ